MRAGGDDDLLGARELRQLADQHGIRPTKAWGQNFVVDANTVRRIARLARVGPPDTVLEVGPGLGSLTLALLATGASITAIEVDPALAAALPGTVAAHQPGRAAYLNVVTADALRVTRLPGQAPTALVANLPYNVSVPVVLTLLERFPSIERVLVMVQLEVAQRLAAEPGSRVYGAPSVKIAWYAAARLVGTVPRSVFWPVPNVDSGLVAMTRRLQPPTPATRRQVFAAIDAAFAQRRKTLRGALAGLAGGAPAAEAALREAGIDPGLRGEQLGVTQFAALAAALPAPAARAVPAAPVRAAGAESTP